MHISLITPTTLLFVLYGVGSSWASASLVPPTVSVNSTDLLNSTAITSSHTGTTSLASATGNGTLSATTTSTTEFPSLTGVPSCVTDCLASAIARVGCSSVVDVNCFCVKPNFTAELAACVLASCPDQLVASETLGQDFCNVASLSPTLTFPPLPTTTTTDAPASTSSEPTSSSTVTSSVNTTSNTSSADALHAVRHGSLLNLISAAFGAVTLLVI